MTDIQGLCPACLAEMVQPGQAPESLGEHLGKFHRDRLRRTITHHHPNQLGMDVGKNLFIVAVVTIVIRKGNCGSEKLSNLPKVTQGVSWLLETM